jgi:hypothetical protein
VTEQVKPGTKSAAPLFWRGRVEITREKRRHSGMDLPFARSYPDLVSWCRQHASSRLGDREEFVHQAYQRCRQRWSQARKSTDREAAYFYCALHRRRRHPP